MSAQVSFEMRSSTSGHSESCRPVILIFVCHYLPGYRAGGPVRSISNLVAALGQEYTFKIVTSDRDLGIDTPFSDVETGKWTRVGNADVLYIRPSCDWLLRCRAIMRTVHPDVIYINSFFARAFSMAPALLWLLWRGANKPSLMLAPRGELADGALWIKAWRKQIYLRVFRCFGRARRILLHASTSFEADDIGRALGRRLPVVVAGLLGPADSEESGDEFTEALYPPKAAGSLRIAFLGRIARNKNLDGALRVVSNLTGDITFRIYGPREDMRYWEECKAIIAAMPSNVRVECPGAIPHHSVIATLRSSDVLFLPTLGENYGHAIIEGLCAGCPTVISDQTAWRGLAAVGVGWDLPLDEVDRFRNVLQAYVDMRDDEFLILRRKAAKFGADNAVNTGTLESNRMLLRQAVTRQRLPKGAANSGLAI